MKRNHHLKELIDNIKQTEAMIALHKTNNTSPLMADQYEALKAKQISELIGKLYGGTREVTVDWLIHRFITGKNAKKYAITSTEA